MARFLYINSDPAQTVRATELGCGWMPAVPPEFANVAVAPCAIVSGAGTTVVLEEPTTAQAVASAAAPILAAEQAANDAAAAQQANADTLRQRASLALSTNATYLAIGSPTAAQVAAQVRALTMEANAVIRLLTNMLDSTAGT